MALVEYSSSSDSEADHQDEQQRPRKRRRRTSPSQVDSPSSQPSPARVAASPSDLPATGPKPQPKSQTGQGTGGDYALPPLPSSFHDLYASTVRTATADLPSLHHGRRRVIPHKEGNWPSHIYAEWHPPAPQHALLRSLLASLAGALGPELSRQQQRQRQRQQENDEGGGGGLAGFLESPLGAPLPLHVSLSRPFVLRTEQKDEFLGDLVGALAGCGVVGGFGLVCDGLGWHRSPDSNRSFLVLRVRSSSSSSGGAAAATTDGDASRSGGRNPELSALLSRCNDLVSSYGQPKLYAASHSSGQRGDSRVKEGGEARGDAFHVSIAWSFAEPTDEICRRTAEVFARPEFRDRIARDITIPVEGVKAKIGNVVTNIELSGKKKGRKGRGLFGEV